MQLAAMCQHGRHRSQCTWCTVLQQHCDWVSRLDGENNKRWIGQDIEFHVLYSVLYCFSNSHVTEYAALQGIMPPTHWLSMPRSKYQHPPDKRYGVPSLRSGDKGSALNDEQQGAISVRPSHNVACSVWNVPCAIKACLVKLV